LRFYDGNTKGNLVQTPPEAPILRFSEGNTKENLVNSPPEAPVFEVL
jgi:hypothetical protein